MGLLRLSVMMLLWRLHQHKADCTAAAVNQRIGASPAAEALTYLLQVRKKAVMALHRFEQLDPLHEGPLSAADIDVHLRRMLCDKVGGLSHAVHLRCAHGDSGNEGMQLLTTAQG